MILRTIERGPEQETRTVVMQVEKACSGDELLRELQAVESLLDEVGDPPDLDAIRELVRLRASLRARTRAHVAEPS